LDSKTVKEISFFVMIVTLAIAAQINRKTLMVSRITKGFTIIDKIVVEVVTGGRTVITVVVVLGVVIITEIAVAT